MQVAAYAVDSKLAMYGAKWYTTHMSAIELPDDLTYDQFVLQYPELLLRTTMKFTIYACSMPYHTEYEYTWGTRVGNYSDRDLTNLIRSISTTRDLVYGGTITLLEYYADRHAVITPLWFKYYRSLEQLQSSILADITAERPELLI